MCIYSRYHTITDICTTALLLRKPSSDETLGSGMVLGPKHHIYIYIYIYIYICTYILAPSLYIHI